MVLWSAGPEGRMEFTPRMFYENVRETSRTEMFARSGAAMQGFWNDNMTEGIGFVAAACTTFAFVPQLVKIRRQGGRDLSYFMLGIYLAGLVLWLVYGLRLRAPAIIAANIVAMVLVVAAIIMKAIMDRRISVTPSPQMERPMASSQVKDVIPETRSRSAEAAPGLN